MKRPHMRFDLFRVTKRDARSNSILETTKTGQTWLELGRPVVVADQVAIVAPTTDVCFKHDCDHEVVADGQE